MNKLILHIHRDWTDDEVYIYHNQKDLLEDLESKDLTVKYPDDDVRNWVIKDLLETTLDAEIMWGKMI